MAFPEQILSIFKTAFAATGVHAMRRRYVPFGLDYVADVAALSRAWGLPLEVVFDVGANLGQTSDKLLAAFPSASVFAFEPHPDTFRTLTRTRSGHDRLNAFNVALSDADGSADFYEYGMSQINSLTNKARYAVRSGAEPKVTTVSCVRMDRFCAEHAIERVDLLKIDTEGHDLMVLQGATGLLTDGRVRFVYVEYNDIEKKPEAVGGNLREIDAFLRPLGFRFVTSYTDYVIPDTELFVVANALFARPPEGRTGSAPVFSPFEHE
jgi:FkbM family methyltransferase